MHVLPACLALALVALDDSGLVSIAFAPWFRLLCSSQ